MGRFTIHAVSLDSTDGILADVWLLHGTWKDGSEGELWITKAKWTQLSNTDAPVGGDALLSEYEHEGDLLGTEIASRNL